MSKWPKRIVTSVVLLLIVILVGAIALDVVLKNHLNELLNKFVVPAAEKKMDVDVSINDAEVSLFKGDLDINGITVENPKGFSEPSVLTLENLNIQMNLSALLRGGLVHISSAEVNDAELTIVRRKNEPVNLKVIADRISPPAPPEHTDPAGALQMNEEEGPEEQAGELPKATVDQLVMNTRVRYIDHAILPGKPLDFILDLVTTVNGLATFEDYNGDWAEVFIEGSLFGKRNICVTDLRGQIGPVVDPVKASFNLAGDIAAIDMDLVQPYLTLGGFDCSSLSIKVNMVCREGEFDSEKSYIALEMKDIVLTGSTVAKLPPGFDRIPSISVPIPLGGTVSQPELNFTYAFLRTISDNFQANIGEATKELVDNLGVDGKKSAEALTKLIGNGKTEGKGLLEGLVDDKDAAKAAEVLQELGGDKDTAEDLIKSLFGDLPGKSSEKGE